MLRGIKKFSTLVVFFSLAGVQNAQAEKIRAQSTNNVALALFPEASCNVKQMLPVLRQRLDGKYLETKFDGDFPWPEVLGIWTRPDRDAYTVVGATEIPGAKWAKINVTIRSICTDKILAQGTRIITDSDWTKEYLVVRLRNYSLNGNRLTAVVKNPQEEQCFETNTKKLDVRMVQESYDENGILRAYLRDVFMADRL